MVAPIFFSMTTARKKTTNKANHDFLTVVNKLTSLNIMENKITS